MRAVDIIAKKRDGLKNDDAELRWLVAAYVSGEVADYQMAAWCMAARINGLDEDESTSLALAMAASGEQVDLDDLGFTLDKHSTGGVADTTTLILCPLVAACGGRVAKMSGRGLGHTGGTIDKLASIPGFRTGLDAAEFRRLVAASGLAVAGQSASLAPADKLMYALRDATATIDCAGLIASSVMSKKLAAGAKGILLDVKTGRGAFMKSLEASRRLAALMVRIGIAAGRKVEAVITDMDEPLGSAIGNALEVREAIETLAGKGPARLEAFCCALAGRMLKMAGLARTHIEGEDIARNALEDGRGLERFRLMVAGQGGNPRVVEDLELLPRASYVMKVITGGSGYVQAADCLALGEASVRLGAGRAAKDDPIDLAVGITLVKRPGDEVAQGDVLALVHANDPDKGERCVAEVAAAYVIGDCPPAPRPLIYETIDTAPALDA